MFALIVEDGTGVPGANSYASLDDAAAYHAASSSGAVWGGLDDAARGPLLVRATRTLDALCQYPGAPLTGPQSLRWPRQGVVIDGWRYPPAVIPSALKNAVAELAATIQTSGVDPTAPVDTDKLSSVKVGTVEIDFRAPVAYPATADKLRDMLPSNVYALLLPILGQAAPEIVLQRA